MAGSAISTLVFKPGSPSSVESRRVHGTRAEKLKALTTGNLPPLLPVPGKGGDPFGLIDWGTLAHGLPITKFFRKHYPGVKTHRDELIIDVDRAALIAKLQYWNALPPTQRTENFHNSATRTAPANHTVDPTLVVDHRYRPLDERYLYKADAFIDRPGTISRIYQQVPGIVSLLTMDTRTTAGPVVIASDSLPGYNSFRGSYETHCFPLVGLPPEGQLPGAALPSTLPDALTPGARAWANSLGASTEDVACYMLALGNAPSYQHAFAEALEADIVLFPAITDKPLFQEAVPVGERLLKAWKLQAAARGSWTQAATGTQLGEAQTITPRGRCGPVRDYDERNDDVRHRRIRRGRSRAAPVRMQRPGGHGQDGPGHRPGTARTPRMLR